MMANLHRDTDIIRRKSFLNGKWCLNIYVLKSRSGEIIPEKEINEIIEDHLCELEQKCMSSEFEYFRIGFAFLHYGNRGVDLTIWHYGKWGNTFETFVCSWYCYNHDINNMELLDSAEPKLCQYEMECFASEITKMIHLLKSVSASEVKSAFLQGK